MNAPETPMRETPIYDGLVVEMAGRLARDFVRRNFHACPICAASPGYPCLSKAGKVTTRHKARRWV